MAVIRYLVNDVDVAMEFYVKLLGFELVDKLTQSGARFRNEIVSRPGGKQVLINDPSGNP